MIEEYSLIRLFPEHTHRIVEHITNLEQHDRYLRFGYSASPDAINDYVNRTINGTNIRTDANFWFGIVYKDVLEATLHVAISGKAAEFAFTTSNHHRGKKLGQLLFARGYQLVTEFGIDRIFLACLSENKAMIHIARKFGLAVMTHGTDAEGTVNVQYPVSLKHIEDVKYAIIDKNILR